MKIGIQELLLVFIVALIVLGPDKLPLYARKFGQALGQFRKFSDEATKDIRESIVEPLEEAQRPLREAMEPITDLEKTVKGNLNDIQKSFSDIGKPKKAPDSTVTQASEPSAAPKADLQNADSQQTESGTVSSQASVSAASDRQADRSAAPADVPADSVSRTGNSDAVYSAVSNSQADTSDTSVQDIADTAGTVSANT